jgi:hypothetical protein
LPCRYLKRFRAVSRCSAHCRDRVNRR